MISFVEIYANVKRFGFETFLRSCKLLNEMKGINILKIPLPLVVLFQICVMTTSVPKFIKRKKIHISVYIYIFVNVYIT